MTFARHALGALHGPHIDYPSLMPFLILAGGALVVLLAGLLGRKVRELVVPSLTLATLAAAIVDEALRLGHPASIVSGALSVDGLAIVLDLIFAAAAVATVLISLRVEAPRSAGQGEYHATLLFSVLGMAILVSAQNTVTLFVGFELLSIPLYVLCASELRREGSLESGLKYLVIGSVGSATLVYGLAMIYGATGATQFQAIASAIVGRGPHALAGGLLGDPLLLTGLGLALVGFAFKASVAPFHQWTPDVYEGAPTPVTAFMATATKAAALGVLLRFLEVAVPGASGTWAPAVAAVAAITIVVGNVGALAQTELKRLLGYSGVAQAGYMLAGVVVDSRLGADATVLYLAFYLMMNIAAFAVIVAVARTRADGSEISGISGLGRRDPWLAWSMTIAMLALAGIPGTVGFIGKFQLIHALVSGGYTWLAIVLVVGSMISLGYYLRVAAAIWMRDEVPAPSPLADEAVPAGLGALAPIAGGSPELDARSGSVAAGGGSGGDGSAAGGGDSAAGSSAPGARPRRGAVPIEAWAVAVLCAGASVVFGVLPSPLFSLAAHAGRALFGTP
ncbi:MAG TPA: NADH-quinone oxidoreductase subunit N [Solirubrobacteraceae bacterium]|nr:NADH-quinone oxidoreductase subunit N [Solirubrobacteraceae bacterium]